MRTDEKVLRQTNRSSAVEEAFKSIADNSVGMESQAKIVDQKSESAQAFSNRYGAKMQEVVALYEQSNQTIDALNDQEADQRAKVAQIIASNDQVKAIVEKLRDTVE